MTTPNHRAATPRHSRPGALPAHAGARDAQNGAASNPSHARSLRNHRVARGIAMGVIGVVVFGASSAAALALKYTGNIDSIDSDRAMAIVERPEAPTPTDADAGVPLNIVLIGTDDRSGENASLGGVADGIRSDTTMVMHISADRSRVDVVSIPRDSVVDIPRCPTSAGKLTPAKKDRFNAAFAQGVVHGKDVESGALCTMTTIEQLTDVRMDGFVAVDFGGFLNMIDALGGVSMCIPNDIYSPKAGNLTLKAGFQTLDGATALQYARARKGEGLGDQSDIARIGRQQQMMSALATGVLQKNVLSDAPQLVQFLDAVTKSLTMSSKFSSLTGMPGLAYSLRNVDLGGISFQTVPWVPDPANPKATVVWSKDADLLWSNMKNDLPLDTPVGGVPSPVPAATPDDTPATDESTVATPDQGAATDAPDDTAPTPEPTETKEAGREAFTSADNTAVCAPA